MKKKIDVSFIIVTWNNHEIIEDCLDSLQQYCSVEHEVIVVDNASQDSTCEIIKQKYGNQVHLIESKDNLGFSKANNLGLEFANGEYIFFVNPDVIFIEDITTPMIEVLENHKEVGIVSPCLLYKDQSYQVSTCNFPSAGKIIWDDFNFAKFFGKNTKMKKAQARYKTTENRYVDWSYGAAHLCREGEVRAVKGYPEGYFMYGEDTEFCMSFLHQLNKKTYYLGSSKLIHLGGFSEMKVVNSKKIVYGTNAAMYFVNKYYGQKSLRRYRICLFMVSEIKYLLALILSMFSKNKKYTNYKNKFKASAQSVLAYKIGEQN